MNTYEFKAALIGSLCVVMSCSAGAQAARQLPLWEIGAFGLGISQLAYPGSDQQVKKSLALPYFVYRGEWLRADEDGAGLRAIRTERFELDLSFSGSLGAGSSTPVRAREGMARLGTLIEFGPVGRWRLNDPHSKDRWTLDLPVRGVFDLNHRGEHRGFSLEPELGYERRNRNSWSYGANASVYVGDQRLGATFYSVAPSEARPDRQAYVAKSGLVAWRLSASLSRELTEDLRVFGFVRIESVATAANRASPLVRQTNGTSAGLGLSYTWLRSQARASD